MLRLVRMSISGFITDTTLIDSHAHLSAEEFDLDAKQVVDRAQKQGIAKILDVSVDYTSALKSLIYAERFPGVVFSFVGIDPEAFEPGSPLFIGLDTTNDWFSEQYLKLRELISKNRSKIVGIGETGMDFYHIQELPGEDRQKSIDLQKRLYNIHIELAQEFKLPLTIHSRRAEKECLAELKGSDVAGIFHSYTGNYETAKKILDLGCGLGVNGIITFKNAEELRMVYKKILGKIPATDMQPSDFYSKGIFFETDAPFLAPDGKRGERNESANVKVVFEQFLKLLNQY